MGWTFMGRPQDVRAELRELYQSQFTQVIDDAVIGRTYYCAVEVNKPGKPREVYAGVALYSLKGGEFGYKEMDESMGPYYFECPIRILDKLTPPTSSYAAEWRNKCRAHHASRRARRATA